MIAKRAVPWMLISVVLVGCQGGGTEEPAGDAIAKSDARKKKTMEQAAAKERQKERAAAKEKIDDTPLPPGAVFPIPDDLWKPDAASLPAAGNYVHLESDQGDYVGQGRTYTYTPRNALIKLQPGNRHVEVRVEGDEEWRAGFHVLPRAKRLRCALYEDVVKHSDRYPTTKSSMLWFGESRSCTNVEGWFAIDHLAYEDNKLAAIDLRFEQHCDGKEPALRGKIHWTSKESGEPPVPVYPPPEDLWRPDPQSLPREGNYLYLVSEKGDFVGGGNTYVLTPPNARVSVTFYDGELNVSAQGDDSWRGTFKFPRHLKQIKAGLYDDVQRPISHNPVKGGMEFSGRGKGCNKLRAWFVVDNVTFQNNKLTSIDLRFEQHCEGAEPALYGQIHWSD